VRRRITALVAATTSIVLLAFLVPAAYLVLRVARSTTESRAQAQMQSLIPLVAVGDDAATKLAVTSARTQGFLVWVTMPDGSMIGADPAAGRLAAIGQRTAAITDIHGSGLPQGILFAQPVGLAGGVAVIRIVATQSQLTDGVHRTWLILALLGFALFALALLVADRLARSLARPVTELASAAGRLESGALDTRVVPAGPAEIREVGTALNRLARRIVELLAAERESVADLSHRLRTPITALRLDADALRNPDERDRLSVDVDELNAVIDELIREARRPIADPMGAHCDAAEVLRDRMRFWTVLAREQSRPVMIEVPDGALPVRVGASDLGAAVDALLGNVFAHTPPGAAVQVRLGADPVGARLVISDDGPGLPDAALSGRGESGSGSTGLGLSIVRGTAESSDGSMAIERSATGGVEVTVLLGRPIAVEI
jgi:signal transduction histidine kinase